VGGRRGIWEKLRSEVRSRMPEEKLIWVHCASLGEFEQGRPIIERIKAQGTRNKILLTFFSPSGYEIRKDYKGADWVFYLPIDGKRNAKRFLEIVNPSLVIFVKYEYWYYYLKTIRQNNIPLLLVSSLFRQNDIFFKWHGGLQRKMLSFFSHLFVQNESSRDLLNTIGLAEKCTVSGDTRFDRVIEIAENATSIPEIEKFIDNNKAIIAGSTWPHDEKILKETIETINDPSLKLIIAPHEINEEHISQLQKLFPAAVLYSQLQIPNPPAGRAGFKSQISNILIIDNIGLLSRLYKYAFITYVGGGFGKGIHNTLEAAVYGKPVFFGPVYQKFNEAVELIKTGGAISIQNSGEFISTVQQLMKNENEYGKCGNNAKAYVYSNKGATEKILKFIHENLLLTN